MRSLLFFLALTLMTTALRAQDSVDVTFRYAPVDNPSLVHLPGEFNNWADNSNGSINPGAQWTMEKQPDGSWIKTIRLRLGGGSGPEGAYEYKFNHNGASDQWRADPLNPRTYGSYLNNIIYVRRPTVFHVQPIPGSVLATSTPEIVADVFPVTSQSIDTVASHVLVDGQSVGSFGSAYDAATGVLRMTLPPLADGRHSVVVVAAEPRDYESRDSTWFEVSASPLRWLSRSNPSVYEEQMQLEGFLADAGITDVVVVRNGLDSAAAVIQGDRFTVLTPLAEGDNSFQAFAQLDGNPVSTTRITLHRIVDHTPHPVIQLGASGGMLNFNAAASTDPDGDALTFRWISEDALNPEALNLDQSGALVSIPIPSKAGEYYIRLEATDPAMNTGYTRNYVRVPEADGSPGLGHIDGNADWVRDAIVYEIFVPAFSASGDLRGVTAGVPYLKSLGINTLWLMPIFDNPGSINSMNAGYSVIDFYAVDESIGTTADFDELVDSCHANGIRVVLDMTPNHVADTHPWVEDIRKWKDYSIYRSFVEQRLLGDDRGLGHSLYEEENYTLYARYSNWRLANLNLTGTATQRAMMDVYRYWLVDRRADGFRLDVYWGPQNRYGEKTWWRPFREKIKYYKPEVMLLGETDGTGVGSEINFADGGGALDIGYDWSWYGQIQSTLSGFDIDALHDRMSNYSPNEVYTHHTGPNASYFRFLENHDETRIAEVFQSNAARTLPAAAVMLTGPGIPMIYAGQEIGWRGRRNRIAFGSPPSPEFLPYYRKLTGLRGEYRSLRSRWINRLDNSTGGVYSFLRPMVDENILTIANFRDLSVPVTVELAVTDLDVSSPLLEGTTYYLNDLMHDSTYAVTIADFPALQFDLAAFQTRVLLFSDSAYFPLVTAVEILPEHRPGAFALEQNFPNPVPRGTATTLRYALGGSDGSRYRVQVVMYDQLGRTVLRTADVERSQGSHRQVLDLAALPAGHYTCRIAAHGIGTDMFWTETQGITILR